jgi:hypothetical protein
MSIKKVIIAGLAGGIVYFVLGWLVFGILMKDFYAAHTNTGIMRPEKDMIWWAMVVSNLTWGIFMAYVLNRFGNANSLGSGFMAGATISLLISACYSLGFYAYSTMYGDMTGLAVDIILGTVVGGIIGAVVGFVLGKIKD